MKRKIQLHGLKCARCLVTAVLVGSTGLVQAADGLYLGGQGGLMSYDRPGFDDSVNAGFTLGYEFLGVGIGDIAVEGVYTTTVDEGDKLLGDWGIDTLALYGVMRTAGPIYLKAKAGVLNEDIDAGPESRDDTGFSGGLGIGLSIGIAQLEFEYTRIEKDIDFVGLAINIKTPL